MAIREEVRDGFLGDLPEDLRVKIMNIHKLVVSTVNDVIKNKAYDPIRNTTWAKTMIDEFCIIPQDKTATGSVRLYKKGKKYACMIQLTGHVNNNRNDIDHELFHDFIRNVHQTMRTTVRRKYDMTLTCESEHGEHFEGFDVWPNHKVAKELWDKFGDMKTKKAEFHSESVHQCVVTADMEDLPIGLQEMIEAVSDLVVFTEMKTQEEYAKEAFHLNQDEFEADRYAANRTSEKATRKSLSQLYRMDIRQSNNISKLKGIFRDPDQVIAELNKFEAEHPNPSEEELKKFYDYIRTHYKRIPGRNRHTDKMTDQQYRFKALRDKGMRTDPKYKPGFGEAVDIGFTEIIEHTDGTYEGSIVISDICEFDESNDFNKYRSIVSDYDSTKELVYNEETSQYELILTPEYAQKLYEYLATNQPQQNTITEATNDLVYNVKMSEKDAKRSLHSVSVEIINSSKPPVQYTADIYANIITKNLLPIWAGGLRKLSITLDTKCKQPIFEFKIPSMTQDFVARFVEGREPLNGLLRRNPDVKIRMSPATFKTMKDPDDAFKFFRAAIRYYESGVMKYADKIMTNFMKLDHNTKQLISTTKLGGLVTLPLQWLFQFDNVGMSDPSIFNISSTDIQQINGFIKNIYSKYAAPEKEKQKILDDLNSTIQAMRESCESDDNFRSAIALTEAVGNWYSGKFDAQIKQYDEKWITEQTDLDWLRNPPSSEIRILQEKTQMKKLKKIPRDLVAYITIETESINDANDKMMIASYCLSKLEIVEWYIELIDVGSKRYIVPHSRPYLETLRTELLRCYSNIMKVKITPPSERPLIDIKYPKGYED